MATAAWAWRGRHHDLLTIRCGATTHPRHAPTLTSSTAPSTKLKVALVSTVACKGLSRGSCPLQ